MIRDLWIVIILLMILACYTLTGCATTPGSAPAIEEVVVKYDLFGTINGVPFDGIGVIPIAKNYNLKIESKQDVDLITITTCHREFSQESVIQTGWFKTKRGFEYSFAPAPGIEDTSSCLLRIGTYNKDVQNQNAHAIIDFVTPTETLPATNICNGAQGSAGGVTVCQSKVGLIQRLKFPGLVTSLVKSETTPGTICQGTWVTPTTWEYKIVEGECIVAFIENEKPHRLHRHTAIGYTKVAIRGK